MPLEGLPVDQEFLEMSQVTVDQAMAIALQHHQAGRWAEAAGIYQQVIGMQQNHAGALHLLGVVTGQRGGLMEGIGLIRRAIAIYPKEASFHSNLGKFMSDAGLMDDAIVAYRAALRLQPNHAKAHNNLAAALFAKGLLDDAIVSYREALRIDPGYAMAYNNLGNVYKEMGELDEAMACYRRSLELKPDFAAADGHLVYLLHFHPGYDGRAIREELRRWNRQHAEPLKQLIRPPANDRTVGRRLRVGYVSPDFRDHVVGRNLLPLFREHDRGVGRVGGVEIFCYSNVVSPDAVTAKFQQMASAWRSLIGVTDEQAAEQIRADGIDILVDLTLHMAGSNLRIFARKPAPVQVTFAGYPGSTGLETMDYRLTDRYLDPAEVGGGLG